MLTPRVISIISAFTLGTVALGLPSAASAQGYGSRYGGYVDLAEDDYAAPVPPRSIPDYRRGAVETVVTTTRRVVTSRPADYEYGDADEGPVRRVIVQPPVRYGPRTDVVVMTGSVHPRPYNPGYPVYKSEPVYAPSPAWQGEVIAARPRYPAQPVIIEERRVETTRRILAPAPLD